MTRKVNECQIEQYSKGGNCMSIILQDGKGGKEEKEEKHDKGAAAAKGKKGEKEEKGAAKKGQSFLTQFC